MIVAGLPSPSRHRWQKAWFITPGALALAVGAGGLLATVGSHRRPEQGLRLPAGIVAGSVRVEAELVDIATRGAGRIKEVLVAEGDPVAPGQVLACMDRAELDASLARARADFAAEEEAAGRAAAAVMQQEGRLDLARQGWARALPMAARWSQTRRNDAQRTAAQGLAAEILRAVCGRLLAQEERVRAASTEVARIQALVNATTLTSPVRGLVHSRLASSGEVLAAGGKALTVLDLDQIYMESFLPAQQAGRLLIGSEAKLLLDVLPGTPIPARIVFVSPTAQLSSRRGEEPMFRVKAELSRGHLRARFSQLGSGLRGTAYFRLDAALPWPGELEGHPAVSSR